MSTESATVQAASAEPAAARRGPVSARSILVGLVGVGFIALVTPYNNYVLNNTDFIGSHLPASLLVFVLLIVLLINAPLRRWLPRQALSAGELAVALGMTLVACALPSVGLMRYLPGHLVAPFAHAAQNYEHAELLRGLEPPDWMWPRFESADPVERGAEPVVADFFARAFVEDPTFWNHITAVPWRHWLVPAFSWGLFLSALFGAVICLSVIFHRQWVENERLAFPLATVYLSLIEPPEKGRALNRLLRSRVFWITFIAVFCLHGFNALHVYAPRTWPQIPLGFDLGAVLAEEPWRYTSGHFKSSRIIFTIVGIMFLVQARIAFSLWFFYLLFQGVRMVLGMRQMEFTGGVSHDQMFGALLAVGATVLWVARHHLMMVMRQMFRHRDGRAPQERYLPYSVAGWGLLGCALMLIGWLSAAGASLAGAVVIVGLLLLVYTVLARVVAETGLLYVLLPAQFNRAWLYAGDISGGAIGTTLHSKFFGQFFFGVLLHDTREASSVYITHALRVADESAYRQRNWQQAGRFIAVLMLALAAAFVLSGASTLWCHYNYAATLDQSQTAPIGEWGSFRMADQIALSGTQQYAPPRTGPVEPHSRVGHLLAGIGITGVLSMMNLRFAAWPFHPVGYLLANSWGMSQIWFSVLLGWLAKVLIVRFGGTSLFGACRPLFLGLIFGEAAAVVFWLSSSVALSTLGYEYHAIHLLPV